MTVYLVITCRKWFLVQELDSLFKLPRLELSEQQQVYQVQKWLDDQTESKINIVNVTTIRPKEKQAALLVVVNNTKHVDNLKWVYYDRLLKGLSICEKNVIQKSLKQLTLNDSHDNKTYIIYSDGGSRGNPGHSAAAFLIYNHLGEKVTDGGDYLGITTSAVAEYTAVKLALEAALKRGIRWVECRTDNLMVVNQLKSIYLVKNRDLWPIHENIANLIKQFDRVDFKHVKRELNAEADHLANEILDRYLTKY